MLPEVVSRFGVVVYRLVMAARGLKVRRRSRARRSLPRVGMAVAAAVGLVLMTGSAGALAPPPRERYETFVAQVVRNDAAGVPTGVVSLGDSYSSGLGAGPYDEDCKRTEQAWGNLIFDDAVSPSDRFILACSGSGIADVYGQLDELAALGESGGRLITLTVGGNDIGFATELARCFIPFAGCADREPVLLERIEGLVEPLAELYGAVQAITAGDVLIVGGYPLLVPDPQVRDQCRALTRLLSTAERQMIRRLTAALNDAIDEAAATAGVLSTSTALEAGFDGHEACDNGPDDWLNGVKLSLPTDSSPDDADGVERRWDVILPLIRESFHPNEAGQAGYADAFTEVWTER